MTPDADVVHDYFGLSYSSYQVLPRSVLQSLPGDLQRRFVDLMREINAVAPNAPGEYRSYVVLTVDHRLLDNMVRSPDFDVNEEAHRRAVVVDDFADYERGRRRVALRGEN